jgi:hypothetical protein
MLDILLHMACDFMSCLDLLYISCLALLRSTLTA